MTTAIAAAVAIVPSTLAGVGIAIATGKAAAIYAFITDLAILILG